MKNEGKFIAENYTFEGQKEDEEIILVLRKHPWTLSAFCFKLLIAAVFLTILFIKFGLSWVFSYFFFPIFIVCLYFGYKAYFNWQNNLYLLTNLRILAVMQQGFFHRKVSEIYLDKISDIAYEIKGFWQTMLNYGEVLIKGEGEQTFTLKNIENPYTISQKVMEVAEGIKKQVR